eukprot:UN18190
MTPFFPWQRSHLKHHNYHNHATKDWSHPSRYETEPIGHIPFDDLPQIIKRIFPFIAWPTYITYGAPDGSHYVPLPSQQEILIEKDKTTKGSNTKSRQFYYRQYGRNLRLRNSNNCFVLYFGSFRR